MATDDTYLLTGRVRQIDKPPAEADGIRIESARQIEPGLGRASEATVELKGDEIVRVELENGFVLWSRADDLMRERGTQIGQRDGKRTWAVSFGPRPGRPERGSQRGWVGMGVRVLQAFGVDVAGHTARYLAGKLEDRQLADAPPGLYQCDLKPNEEGVPVLKPVGDIPAGSGPLLVFLHGTASSTRGSFGDLWRIDNAAAAALREQLTGRYGDRIYALQHRSMTESPVRNALDLAARLPVGSDVHLVSHSRGGLVGELMCLGMRDRQMDPLRADWLGDLFAADHTVAEQLGLPALDGDAAKAHKAAYAQERELLDALLETLDKHEIRVTRFVRVACPARGTTLASGRLDRWLSVLDHLSGKGIAGECVDLLLAIIKERTDPRMLPGLEAMMPGSALTLMLRHPDLVTEADLSVIAGDVEGDSVWSRIKLLVADWFYSSDHDLVVNTGSMRGGIRRKEGGARYLEDKGAAVNHFNYFANEQSVRWIAHGLMRTDDSDGGFTPMRTEDAPMPRWRQALARSRSGGAPRPLAVILPGTMGSVLEQRGKRIWIDYWRLLRGQLERIGMGEPGVEPVDLVGDFYGPLIEFMAKTHRVELFPYDWRLSVREAADRLVDALERWVPEAERTGQPVHLVAHSMGGLVVRAMIADGGRGAAIWQRILALPKSRFAMLGTPNLGSYEAVRWLTGGNPTQQKLALLDMTRGTLGVIDIVRRFPGLIELLPFAQDDPDFSDPNLWTNLKREIGGAFALADPAVLRAAMPTWQRLRNAPPDPEHMVYLAGVQPATVTGYRCEFPDDGFWATRPQITFEATAEGDGTVTWASGLLKGVPTYYVADTAHDALCTQVRAFPGLHDLLMTGETEQLPDAPPAARANQPLRFPMPDLPFTDDLPDASDLGGLGFGGSVSMDAESVDPMAPPIRVSVRHGDLAYARHPVVVGHYTGDAIVSAEAALDGRLGGQLSRRVRLGMYPDIPGTHALFVNDDPFARPLGALVVGLGLVGELSPRALETSVRTALLEFALQVLQWPDDARFGPKTGVRSAAVSCLLVGTGAGGIPVSASVDAILRAAVAAADQLFEQGLGRQVAIDAIEFVEIYEDVAIKASEALVHVLRDGDLSARIDWADRNIQSGEGRRRRVRSDDEPDWWHRLEISEDEAHRNLRFVFATDRARAEQTLSTGQLALAESFVRQAARSPAANSEVAKTLFEMLLPNRLKLMAPEQSNMVLMLDERSARYPWELLENRWGACNRPSSVAAGLVRQLKSESFREKPLHSQSAKAFVVGNPDLKGWQQFPDLPGARREAAEVASILRGGGFSVVERVDAETDDILSGLHRDAWRILHLAGHGEHDFELPDGKGGATRKASGMVIGEHAFLTPGDVEQMRWVPEVVFINCCHLGRTDRPSPPAYTALAANLAVQFVRMGVRAVIAAGWAVDDQAASAFAGSFYRHLLAGQPFGEAVRAAREVVWSNFPGVNTWGAYQCYGDPSYRLRGEGSAPVRRPLQPFYAPVELVVELDNHREKVRMQFKREGQGDEQVRALREGIGKVLARVPEDMLESWTQRADVAAALGFVWGEIGAFAEAIHWLELAMRNDAGDCPVRAVEQCANFKVRLAGQHWIELNRSGGIEASVRQQLVKDVQGAIMELDLICQRAPTPERFRLLGSACKRLAWLQRDDERPRLEALINMANYYRLAGEEERKSGRTTSAYTFSNWALAEVLKGKFNKAPPPDEAWLRECDETIRRTLVENEKDPNVWSALGEPDCLLVKLLARSSSRRLREEAELILAVYQRVLARGASPRERASVVEHMDFVIAMCEDERPLLREMLAKIRAAL